MSSVRGESRDLGVAHALAACSPGPVRLFMDEHPHPERLVRAAYLLDLGDGRALTMDASRDLRGPRAAAERRGLRIAFAADTHLHADFLSGAVQISAFSYLRAVQADDVEAAREFASGEPRMPELLVDVAMRIVVPVTALPRPEAGEPCADTFALEAPNTSS
jgi:glyoxylase-like metal-dependent hydrolase (beta-lactamase superfamily II)